MEYPFIFLQDSMCRSTDALIHVQDLGLLRAFAVFDYLRVRDGQPVFLEDHLDRFLLSAEQMNIPIAFDKGQLEGHCRELIRLNEAGEAGLRLLATGGYSEDGYTPSGTNFCIMLHPMPAYPETHYSMGVRLISLPFQRSLPRIKTTVYHQVLRMRDEMKEKQAVELLHFHDGILTECSRSNIFFIDHQGQLVTPGREILEGVTRKKVIELMRTRKPVIMRDIEMKELPSMSEAFITSTTKGIMPVNRIDDIRIGNGLPGQVTLQLTEDFTKLRDAQEIKIQ